MAKLRKFSGFVTRWKYEFGHGFVRINEMSGRDAFLHVAGFEEFTAPDQVCVGMKLEFFLENAPKGLRAFRAVRSESE